MQYPAHIQALLLSGKKCRESAPIRQETPADKRQAASEMRDLAKISATFGDRQGEAGWMQGAIDLEDEASLLETKLVGA